MALHNHDPKPSMQSVGFDNPLPSKILNIEDKSRSNLLTWRGQFSPQLVESLLLAYCPKGGVVLDPFSGSGTVIFESALFGSTAYGVELNPSAWILSRIYQLANYNTEKRSALLSAIKSALLAYFPEPELLYASSDTIDIESFRKMVKSIGEKCSPDERIVFDGLIVLLDVANNAITLKHIHDTFYKLSTLVSKLPILHCPIQAILSDARSLPLPTSSVDFVLTSPPYINVFNYHQNYRKSAEMLDWDLLQVARSEIGSNRANRGNRFLTVIQYCLDMLSVLTEVSRVCKETARVILVVGYESNVLGVPFYNADILEQIACDSGLFRLALRQKREFRNKFGTIIREDLLHLELNTERRIDDFRSLNIARHVAYHALCAGSSIVAPSNAELLADAIEQIDKIKGTPLFSIPQASVRVIGE